MGHLIHTAILVGGALAIVGIVMGLAAWIAVLVLQFFGVIT